MTISLDQRAFSFWSELLGRWVVEAGEFAIEVGPPLPRPAPGAHRDVDAPSIAAPLTADSTLHEWMADPKGLALIKEAVAAGQPDPTRDAELVSVIGTMPMSTLAAFQRHEHRPRHPRQARRTPPLTRWRCPACC